MKGDGCKAADEPDQHAQNREPALLGRRDSEKKLEQLDSQVPQATAEGRHRAGRPLRRERAFV